MTTFTLKDYIDNMYAKNLTELSKELSNIADNLNKNMPCNITGPVPSEDITCSITSPVPLNIEAARLLVGATGSVNLTEPARANSEYDQKVKEAPYHPGYEDAVITPTPKYTGMDPAKMLWKPKPLTDEEIAALKREYIDVELFDEGDYGMEYNIHGVEELIRAVEERHGIK